MSTVHINISLHLSTCISNSSAEISMSICASGLTLSGVFVVPIINVTWNTLLGACRRWGSIEIGRSAFDCLVKSDVKGAGTFVLMSNLLANVQDTV